MFYVIVPIVLYLMVSGLLWLVFGLFRSLFGVGRREGTKLIYCGLATILVPSLLLQLHCSIYGDKFGPFLNFDGVLDAEESSAFQLLSLVAALMMLIVYFTYIKTEE